MMYNLIYVKGKWFVFIIRKNNFLLYKMLINFKAKVVEINNSLYFIIPDSIVKKEKIKEGEEMIVKIN